MDEAVAMATQRKNHSFAVSGNSSARRGGLIQVGQGLVEKSGDYRREHSMNLISQNPPYVPDLHRSKPQRAFQCRPTCHLDPACPSPSFHLPPIRARTNFYHSVACNVKRSFGRAFRGLLSYLWQAVALLPSVGKNLSTFYPRPAYSILLTVPSATFPTTMRSASLIKRPFSTTPGTLFKVDSRVSGSSIDGNRTSTTKLP